MRHNFTQSGVRAFVDNPSQTYSKPKDKKVLVFVQKIVSVMSLFFMQKNSNKLSNTTQKSGFSWYSTVSSEEKALQEYFTDESNNQLSNNLPNFTTNQDLMMNRLPVQNSLTVKNYLIGSHFDTNLKRKKSSFPSLIQIYNEENRHPKSSFFKGLATTIVLMFFTVLGLSAQTNTSVDLSLSKKIDNSLPALNGTVKYTLWLKNSGPSTANAIVVQDNFPIGGATLLSHNGGVNFNYSAGTGIGLWSVASLASGDSVKLEIVASIIQRGVFFNTAEVKSMGAGQKDIDSTPNNTNLNEDDISVSCFSVPLLWYPGEEYKVSVPAPFKYGTTIKWFRGTTEVTGTMTQAVVNADTSLTIKAPGNYSFTTNVATCPAQGCCAVQVIEGPYGSIGDYVWMDTNNDGIQGTTALEPPVANVKVYLLDSNTGVKLDSTITDGLGKYLFDSLLTGNYKVKFVLPTGSEATAKFLGGDTTKDSNVNPDGTTDAIAIDTTQPLGNVARNNLTIDAGLYSPLGSIGDFVWKDLNNNGIQDASEPGVEGVKMELYASNLSGNPIGATLNTTTTNASGLYSFNKLLKGDYVVRLITSTIPATYLISTKTDAGSDDTKDNDFNATTGYSPKVSIDPLVPSKKDIPTIDGAITLIQVEPIADLSLNKTVSNSTPSIGDIITYYIDVKNDGPSIATNVEVSDIVPLGLQVEIATGGDLMNISGNTVVAKFNQINIGQTATFKIVAKVTASTGTIKNWAQVTKSDQKDLDSTPNNGIDKGEDDDDDADIIIKQSQCNPITPLIACSNPYICLGESVSIEAIGCNGTILWSDGQTGGIITVTPSATTTYTAQCKINDNCISPKSNSVTVVVNVIAAPLITSSSTTNVICGGGKITLKANNCTGTITWSNGTTGASIEVLPTTTTSYTAICKKGECVSGKSNIITITVGTPSNPPTIATNNTSICKGQTAILTASNCTGTIVWSNGSTGTIITITPSATATYSAICKVGECPSATSSIVTVAVSSVETPVIIASKEILCVGEAATLTVTGCTGNISWTGGATTSSIMVTLPITTTYEVKCSNGECVGKATKIITVTPKPTTPIVTCGKERICTGESLTFIAHGCEGIVTWSTGVTGATMTVTPATTTTYTAICTVNGCVSNPSKPATITVINQTPPTIYATSDAVCSGGTVTLTAANCAGVLLWSTGATTAAITVNPTVVTTYTVKCIVEECESSASKTINIGGGTVPTPPVISASQTSLCGDDKAKLTATGCVGGTIKWSTGATGSTISVGTSIYSAICINTCGESAKSSEIVISVGIAPSVPVIATTTNTLCGNNTAILTASGCLGTVKWSTGVTGSMISVGAGTYSAICSNICGDSAKSNSIIITNTTVPTPNITANNETVCSGGSVILTATNCTGTLLWSTGATTPVITVIPTATTTYTVKCSVGECESSTTKIITVSATGGQIPLITASKDGVCVGESVSLTATNCTGALTWSTGATTTSITITPTTTITYEVTCLVGGCSGKATKIIKVTPKPTTPIVTCGKERICAGESLTFIAHGCEGIVTWSTGVTGATMTVTPATTTTYTAICTVNGCVSNPSKPATITVINQTPPTIYATSDAVCSGGTVTLTAANCAGVLSWNTGATTAAITVNPTVATTYTVKCIVEECVGIATKTITIGGGQVPNAPTIATNKTSVCGNETATLIASGCVGSVKWSTGTAGLTISVGAGTYSATCTNECGESVQSNIITIQTGGGLAPVISASITAICEPGNVTLSALGCSGTIVWSNSQTGSSITVNVAITTTFSAICTSGTCESGSSNKITVTVGKPNKPTISSDKTTICAGDAVVLTAVGCTGTTVWSNGLTGSPITVNPTTNTEYTAVCKLPQGGCTSDQSVKIIVNVITKAESPVISCSATRICKGDTLTLNALGCSGTVLWSTGQTSVSININPTVTTVYTAICKVGSCESAPSAAATINVGNPIPPVVSCKNTQICSGSSTQIEAAGCTGIVKWSDGQIGAVITVSPIAITSYSAICDGGRCRSEKSNIITVQVTGSGLTKPTAKDLVNICPYITVDLTTGVTTQPSSQGGGFVFRTGTTPGSPAVTNPSTVGTGTYYVFEKAGNGCYSDGSKINVNITSCELVNPSCVTNPATAKAGKDSTVCLSDDFFTLKGQIGGSASSAKWTTDGKGSFDNALSLNTKYFYSKDDVIKGNVSFTLTTNDPDDNGSCVAASSTFKITLNGVTTVPTIVSNKSPNICFGDSIVLTANEVGIYKWSNGATTKSITVKTPGRYTVKLLKEGGCASLSSNEIVVVLGSAISAPTVASITKNTCPATVVNLNSAVSSQPKSQGGVFEFHTGSAANSPMLANVSAVGAGTYYVLEKSTIGCYSSSSPIIVMIDQCTRNPTDTTQTELSIVIVGSRVELKVGDPITYTITVKNNSTKTATNVNIVNVLPKGLAITSATPGFTAFGTDSLLSVIGSLPGGATKTYTYESKTTKAGKIINTAKITKLDQVDPITSNNISQWAVECKTCQETCVGLALSADTTRQANGSYNITFRALIEACGNVKLEGVKITENSATMFPLPTAFTIVQKPTAGIGSKLITNDSFNGSTDPNLTIPAGSEIEAGKIDTVKFVINIVPNGKEGPFSTNAIVEAIGNTIFGVPQDVSDVSNNGKVVDKPSAEPTVVKLYKSPSIGLAKIVLDTTKKSNGSYNITYQLLVKNNGSLTLNNVILRDTLSKVFKAPATFTVVGVPNKNSGSQLTINSAFNGTGDSRLTLSGSTLAVGKTDTLKFTVNVQPDTLKSFANTAVVSALGTLTGGSTENVTDLSNAGLNPDAPGSNPTNLNLGSDGGSSIEVPCIGIALYVKDTLKQPDGSYNITYNAIIKNCGNLNLSNIQICDTLARTFNSPIIATIIQKPTVSAGSQLKPDNTYDGITNTCMLLSDSQIAPSKVDTIKWVINVQIGDNKGPFRNTVIVTAKTPSGKLISDASNTGIDPNPVGNAPTVINFNNLPDAIIGLSKNASEAVKVVGTTNTYDVIFTFKVKNYGKTDFTGVQVQDNLSVTFGDSVKIDSVNVKVDTGFKANSNFTGRGSLINLLVDSLSTLPKNTTRSITLFIRVTLVGGKNAFENQALAIGKYPSNKSVDDLSTSGMDPDPDANGTPKDNSLATPVKLGTVTPIPTFTTTLGIAKAAKLDSIKNADGTYNLSYTIIIKNYGIHKLTNVQLSDSLGQVFADSAEFVLVDKPTLSKNSKLKIDSTFNGRTISTMLKAESSSLAVGASDTLTFKLRLLTAKQGDAIYANSISGTAKDSTTNVKDLSQAGLNADPDGDKNPGNNNEPTVITIKGKIAIADSLVIIPSAFSPNGDGNGDMFVITGINKTDRIAEIFIYNRWGQLIYQSTDFGKEEGWDGVATNGLLLGSKGIGVPDGTYYYAVRAEGLWEGNAKIGFITIAR